jgi:hypothetical protein
MTEPERPGTGVPLDIRTNIPHPARAEELLAQQPDIRRTAPANRAFMQRVVRSSAP